jgi:hypothetical protein
MSSTSNSTQNNTREIRRMALEEAKHNLQVRFAAPPQTHTQRRVVVTSLNRDAWSSGDALSSSAPSAPMHKHLPAPRWRCPSFLYTNDTINPFAKRTAHVRTRPAGVLRESDSHRRGRLANATLLLAFPSLHQCTNICQFYLAASFLSYTSDTIQSFSTKACCTRAKHEPGRVLSVVENPDKLTPS